MGDFSCPKNIHPQLSLPLDSSILRYGEGSSSVTNNTAPIIASHPNPQRAAAIIRS